MSQERNYIARKEAERKRRELFDDALAKFKKGKVEEVRNTLFPVNSDSCWGMASRVKVALAKFKKGRVEEVRVQLICLPDVCVLLHNTPALSRRAWWRRRGLLMAVFGSKRLLPSEPVHRCAY